MPETTSHTAPQRPIDRNSTTMSPSPGASLGFASLAAACIWVKSPRTTAFRNSGVVRWRGGVSRGQGGRAPRERRVALRNAASINQRIGTPHRFNGAGYVLGIPDDSQSGARSRETMYPLGRNAAAIRQYNRLPRASAARSGPSGTPSASRRLGAMSAAARLETDTRGSRCPGARSRMLNRVVHALSSQTVSKRTTSKMPK